jgi:hypothetical protein
VARLRPAWEEGIRPNGDPERLEVLEAWLASLDARAGGDTARMPVSAAGLGEVTGGLAASTPVVADAVLAGGLDARILERSAQLKALIDGGELAAGLEHFRRSPADGCTSIIDVARIASGYDPTRPDAADNVRRFERFAAAILEAPVFQRQVLDCRPLVWSAASWGDSTRRVLALFAGLRAEDAARIRGSVERLARAAASHPGRVQSGNLFVQTVLSSDAGDYLVHLSYAHASFREIHQHKRDPKYEARLTVARARLRFLGAAWPAYAEAVWNRHVCAVVDWLARNTTAPGPAPVALCFDQGEAASPPAQEDGP